MESGSLDVVLATVKSWFDQGGQQVDFDLRGTLNDVLARALPKRGRSGPGRPKLGVIAREICLLPRHWEWLEQQPSGASAAFAVWLTKRGDQILTNKACVWQLRRLAGFFSAIAGNLPNYEEVTRALYGRNREPFDELVRGLAAGHPAARSAFGPRCFLTIWKIHSGVERRPVIRRQGKVCVATQPHRPG